MYPPPPPVESDLEQAEWSLPVLLRSLNSVVGLVLSLSKDHWEHFLGQDFDFGRWADFGQALLKFLIILIRLIRSIF